MKSHSNLRRNSLLALLSLLILHAGTCQAQQSVTRLFAIPVVIFAFVGSLICICFCACFCKQMFKERQPYGAPANAQHTPYVMRYNQRLRQDRAAQLAGYPAQGYVVPSATSSGVDPPQTRQAYPRQGYVSPLTGAVPSVSPLAHPGAIPQATTSEPVPLPEATLHQGDAPPGYEEAIGMKTVDIAGLDNQQT